MANFSKTNKAGVRAFQAYKSKLHDLCEERSRSKRDSARSDRDVVRRLAARESAEKKRKDIPKARRELGVRLSSIAKQQERHYLTMYVESEEDAMLESQAGNLLAKGAFCALGALAALRVGKAANKLSDAAAITAKTVESVERALRDAAPGVTSAVEEGADAVRTFSAMLQSTCDTFKNALGSWWLVPAGLLAYCLLKHFGDHFIASLVLLPWVRDIMGPRWRWLKSHFLGFMGIQSQSGVSDFAAFVTNLFAICSVSDVPPKHMAVELQRRVGFSERTASGFKALFEQGLTYFEKLLNCVLGLFGKSVDWGDQTDKLLTAWSKKVDTFESLSATQNPTLKELQSAVVLLQEGIGFRQTLRSAHNLTFVNRYIDRLTGAIQAHRGALNKSNAFRMQPQTVMLGGGSGVGKTTVIKWLASAVMLLVGEVDPSEILSNMWQKGISEYWNGYVQQFCYVMDDCFQQKTTGVQQDNDAMFLIRAVGNWAFPLNYADIDSKGRFYFMSDLIVGSTNVADIHSTVANLVVEPRAVVRRIENGYWVFVDPEFRRVVDGEVTPQLDYAKVASYFRDSRAQLPETYTVDQLLSCIPWHAWRIVPHDYSSAAPSDWNGSNFTLLDLAKRLATVHKDRAAAHAAEVSDLESWSSDLAAGLRSQGPSDDDHASSSDSELDDDEPVRGTDPDLGGDGEGPRDVDLGGGTRTDSEDSDISDPYSSFDIGEAENLPRPPLGPNIFDDLSIADLRREIGALGGDPGNPDDDDGRDLDLILAVLRYRLWKLKNARAHKRHHSDRAAGAKLRLEWLKRFAVYVRRMVVDKAGGFVKTFCASMVSDAMNPNMTPERYVWFLARSALVGVALKVAFDILKGFASSVWTLIRSLFGMGAKAQSNEGNLERGGNAPIHFPRFESQMGLPPKDVGSDIPYNNTYAMYVHGDGPDLVLGQVLFIEGDMAVLPYHFTNVLKPRPNSSLTLRSCAQPECAYTIPVSRFLAFPSARMKDTDVNFVRFEKVLPNAHRSIRNHFLTESSLKQFFRNSNNCVRLDPARSESPSQPLVRRTFVCNECAFHSRALTVAKLGNISGLCEYNAPTENGDCGAPLTICEPKHYGGSGLLGIHVAGQVGIITRRGYAAVITREAVISAREHLGAHRDDFEDQLAKQGVTLATMDANQVAGVMQSGLVGGNFVPIGLVDRSIHTSKKSKIFPSPMQEADVLGPCPAAPARLSPTVVDGEVLIPAVEAMRAYQSPLRTEGIDRADAVVEMALRKHWDNTVGYGKQILSVREAASPPPCYKLKPVKRTTSPGYFYRIKNHHGKGDFFGKDGEFDFTAPAFAELEADTLKMEAMCRANERPAVLFVDFLKDETRPLEKVRTCATRAICSAQLDYVLCVRMYFGAFIAASFASHTRSGMAPGINPYRDWADLANRLTSKGGRVFAGDFKRYDASVQPYILDLILKYINKWYAYQNPDHNPQDDVVRNMLWLDLIHSRHVTGVGAELDTVVQWNKCMPSGHPLTTLVNSMYALIALTACYCDATHDYKNMWEHVFLCTYGDDNVVGVDDATSLLFNQVSVSAAMAKLFDLTYTSDRKDGILEPFTNMEGITFLKRSFVRDDTVDGGWVAPLEVTSFKYIPYWCKNRRDVLGEMKRGVEQMLGELCLHSSDTWDELYSPVETFMACCGQTMPFLSRQAARDWTTSRMDAWY
jgi:hypothetical protein